MRILYGLILDKKLTGKYGLRFGRDLTEEIVFMARVSIKTFLRFYNDIHFYTNKESFHYFEDLPITLHETKVTPNIFCGVKLEVLKDQKDTNFIWVGPDVFISSKLNVSHERPIMVDDVTILPDSFYEKLSGFNKQYPQYPMVREWVNSGILWFRDKEVMDYHINLYEELLEISDDARIVESWNASHCCNKFGYYTFRMSGSEYIHLDGYKKYYGVVRDMIKGLDNYL